MRSTGFKASVLIFALAAAALSAALFMSCTVSDEEMGTTVPNGPSGLEYPPAGGTLTIIPSEQILTVESLPAGSVSFFYTVVGGKAPYYWSNTNPNLGFPTPIDEFGNGVYSKARYYIQNNSHTGDDTIIVRDGGGNTAQATFTKTLEEVAPEALAISPTSATLLTTSTTPLTFYASGGVPPYTWIVGSGDLSLSYPSAPDTSVAQVDLSPGSLPQTTSVTVHDNVGATDTATITIEAPPGP